MQDFLEGAKRAASGAVERAAWEADKVRRSTARQRDVELLHRERGALMEQLGSVLLDLETRGQLTQPALKALAERLHTLTDEINSAVSDIQTIRGEPFAPGNISINVQRRDATHAADDITCPTCGRPSRRSAAYCSGCGARLH